MERINEPTNSAVLCRLRNIWLSLPYQALPSYKQNQYPDNSPHDKQEADHFQLSSVFGSSCGP